MRVSGWAASPIGRTRPTATTSGGGTEVAPQKGHEIGARAASGGSGPPQRMQARSMRRGYGYARGVSHSGRAAR